MPPLRLNYNADTEADVFAYYETRARQMAYYGYMWTRELIPFSGGFITYFTKNDRKYGSFFIVYNKRGKGLSKEALALLDDVCIVTLPDCKLEGFLKSQNVQYKSYLGVHNTIAYEMVQSYYGDKRAHRSGALMMNHIDEGLTIMSQLGTSIIAQQAFALHPMLQDDAGLVANIDTVLARAHPKSVAFALEYRNIANAYLSHKVVDEIALSPFKEVNDMLIADKVQNRKDFERYHKETHPRSDILDAYFKRWLRRLGVSEEQYVTFTNGLDGYVTK